MPAITKLDLHNEFMALALAESKMALPLCLPNPPVGCVLVKDGVVVARGFTQAPGRHHAEAQAMANYSGSFTEISAYVTLEPCSFHGRTPSCAQALIDRGIYEVFVAVIDPDPRNSGAGIRALREAGVMVTEGVLYKKVHQFLNAYLPHNKGR